VPIYEYRCKSCDAEFEKYLAGSATAVACPSCESDHVMRKRSTFGMRASSTFQPSAAPSGGGCGGGGCACS